MPTNIPNETRKLIALASTGILHRTEQGAITNIGGTDNNTFTVDGKALLFADGTSTTGGPVTIASDFQSVYDNTVIDPSSNAAVIKLTTGKDFAILDDSDNSIFFRVDAETGKITITGDLEVLGSSTIIETVINDADHWKITPSTGVVSALVVEPESGITPLVDLVVFRSEYAEAVPAFKIASTGNTTIRSLNVANNLTVAGTINGYDLSAIVNVLTNHVTSSSSVKHNANEIGVDVTPPLVSLQPISNVQNSLEQLNIKIDNATGSASNIITFVKNIPEIQWTINHNMGSSSITYSLWDTFGKSILADSVEIADDNTIIVDWGVAQAGKIVIAFGSTAPVVIDSLPPP